MTSRKTSLPYPAVTTSAGPASVLRRLVDAALARQSHRRSLRALAELDDRLLGDIGLTRAEAEKRLALDRI